MRFPVYSSNSNPQVDKPLLRKKLRYVEELIAEHRGYWLNPNDKSLGIKLRQKLTLRERYEESITKIAGAGFDEAWHVMQSGYAGPLTYQLRTASL